MELVQTGISVKLLSVKFKQPFLNRGITQPTIKQIKCPKNCCILNIFNVCCWVNIKCPIIPQYTTGHMNLMVSILKKKNLPALASDDFEGFPSPRQKFIMSPWHLKDKISL
jgi:hypothetical protein